MIRIHKPKTPPEKLTIDGNLKQQELCNLYSQNPSLYETGTKRTQAEKKTIQKFNFASSIYGHATVKQELIKAQHKKCCFCESKIGSDGDVEHFRPKGAYKQGLRQSLQYPGYYWLAYEWDNLYLCCTGCNQRYKQNLFPLQDPTKRATNHTHSIDDEEPLFIDMGKEEPSDFIGFRGEFAYEINGNQRGKIAIKSLGLNSKERAIVEKRLEHLASLKIFADLVDLATSEPENIALQNLAREAKDMLDAAILDNAEFTAANRCAIDSKFQYVIS